VHKLPVGVSGLLVAAIIATAMSTVAATLKAHAQIEALQEMDMVDPCGAFLVYSRQPMQKHSEALIHGGRKC